jgi:hypothetical protein
MPRDAEDRRRHAAIGEERRCVSSHARNAVVEGDRRRPRPERPVAQPVDELRRGDARRARVEERVEVHLEDGGVDVQGSLAGLDRVVREHERMRHGVAPATEVACSCASLVSPQVRLAVVVYIRMRLRTT